MSYMTRIEIQGGGIVDVPTTGGGSWLGTKSGYGNGFFGPSGATPLIQLNAAMAVRISDSNINAFADAGVFAHPDERNALVRTVSATGDRASQPAARSRASP